MDNFREASRQKLRIQTTKGYLAPEQLWDLSVTDLDALAVSLEEEHEQSGKKSFLTKRSVKDKTTKLKFDLVIDVLGTKVAENEAAQEAQEVKAHNKKILELIANKQDESLQGKSIKQLEAMLK